MSLMHPAPNQAVEPTPNSLRSCVAPAIGRGSPRALGGSCGKRTNQPTVRGAYGCWQDACW
jgi:hypothetical protein